MHLDENEIVIASWIKREKIALRCADHILALTPSLGKVIPRFLFASVSLPWEEEAKYYRNPRFVTLSEVLWDQSIIRRMSSHKEYILTCFISTMRRRTLETSTLTWCDPEQDFPPTLSCFPYPPVSCFLSLPLPQYFRIYIFSDLSVIYTG